MNNLIIFDIDGTLIHYVDGEELAYIKAVQELTGIKVINTAWETYQYSTDSGILAEIFLEFLKRLPTPAEEMAIQNAYLTNLKASFAQNPNSLSRIAGVEKIFIQLKQMNWDVAIATGGWPQAAKLKLDRVQIPQEDIPLAHADDHPERAQIITKAISRAQNFYNQSAYQNIIYVGDRLWDYKATQALNIGFIGVGEHLFNLDNEDFFKIKDYSSVDFLNFLRHLNSKEQLRESTSV